MISQLVGSRRRARAAAPRPPRACGRARSGSSGGTSTRSGIDVVGDPAVDPGRAQHLDERQPADLRPRSGRAGRARRPSTARSIAFTPVQGRAEWALLPWKIERRRSGCRGSRGGARCRSARARRRARPRARRGRGEDRAAARSRSTGSSSRAKKRNAEVDARPRRPSASPARELEHHRQPPFMSVAPRPTTQPSSIRPGRLSCAGTVSRCRRGRRAACPGAAGRVERVSSPA